MKIIAFVILLMIGFSAPLKTVPPNYQFREINMAPEVAVASILFNRISLRNQRYPTFQYVLNQITKKNFKIIFEQL